MFRSHCIAHVLFQGLYRRIETLNVLTVEEKCSKA